MKIWVLKETREVIFPDLHNQFSPTLVLCRTVCGLLQAFHFDKLEEIEVSDSILPTKPPKLLLNTVVKWRGEKHLVEKIQWEPYWKKYRITYKPYKI